MKRAIILAILLAILFLGCSSLEPESVQRYKVRTEMSPQLKEVVWSLAYMRDSNAFNNNQELDPFAY